ncbi:MAG TPA: hypothetical protein VLB50_05260 [Ignavibacteriaceae bacterium]|nr:hypothetical protein [Ignavibacteriaceae bacterium]
MKYFYIIILFALAASDYLKGQSEIDSLQLILVKNPANTLSTKLDKQLNTYYLSSRFLYNQELNKFSFNVTENYNSTFIKSADRSIRDEQFFSASGAYRITPFMKIGLSGNNTILSDNRKIEINQASISDALIYSDFSPEDVIHISPFFGYSNNRQIGESDYGYIYGGEGLLDNYFLSNFILTSRFRFRNEDISPRKNLNRYFNIIANSAFNQDVSNYITTGYSRNRKDFYYSADSVISKEYNIVNNIQSRDETNYLLQDGLTYNNFIDNFGLNLIGNLNWRNIDRDTRYHPLQVLSNSVFDTRIEELKLELESNLVYAGPALSGKLSINYSDRNERHIAKNYLNTNSNFFDERQDLEFQKNNNSERVSVSLSADWLISADDDFSLSIYQNKLRYDTPSIENFDDRDELLSIIRLRYIRTLTPFFNTFISAEGTQSHVVYIFSEKSSNNNINRIIKLSAGGDYHGKNVASINSFEVAANYTVYDFRDLVPNLRSFSFRQLTATDSSTIKMSARFQIKNYGYIKLSQQGELDWEAFAEKPTRYLEEIYAEPKIILAYNDISFGLGCRIFSLSTFNYKGKEKLKDSDYLSMGPLTDILWLIKKSIYLRIYGWYEFITVDNVKRQQANLRFEVNWNL